MTEDRCQRIAEAALPRGWEIMGTRYLEHDGRCVVDFLNPDVLQDCNELCERQYGYDSEEFDQCVKDCESGVGEQVSGSIDFGLRSRRVVDATIPVPCYMFNDKDNGGLNTEGTEAQKLMRRIDDAGCGVPAIDWIHPHELVGAPEVDEEADVCFIHVNSRGRHFSGGSPPTDRCTVGELIRAVGQLPSRQKRLFDW